jgi:hypothetical protein
MSHARQRVPTAIRDIGTTARKTWNNGRTD